MEEGVLKQLVLEKKSTWEISRILQVPQSSLRYWLKKYDLKTTPEKQHRCACGETNPIKFYGHKKRICGSCVNKGDTRRGQEKMQRAREYLGGKCVNSDCPGCIYESALQIHHLDPLKKDLNFTSKRGWCWERLKKEIDKCILLCSNCHTGLHNSEWQLTLSGKAW